LSFKKEYFNHRGNGGTEEYGKDEFEMLCVSVLSVVRAVEFD
jgi:hypothetical protein